MNAPSRRAWLPLLVCLALRFAACHRISPASSVSSVSPADRVAAGEAYKRAALEPSRGPAAGANERALADLNSAIAHDPTVYYYYRARGQIREKMGDLDAALADYNRLIELAANYADAYLERGWIYYAQRDWNAALKDFHRADELSPGDLPQIHLYIWLVRARTGEKAAADKELADYLTKHRQKIHSDYGEWETRIADFLLDKIQETDLFKPPFNSKNGYFFSYYIGMKRLLSGDKSGAVESFMKGSAPIETGQPEYLFTAAELKSLGQQTAEK
jgi:tetratricopeptide (TPR) repeat protein